MLCLLFYIPAQREARLRCPRGKVMSFGDRKLEIGQDSPLVHLLVSYWRMAAGRVRESNC